MIGEKIRHFQILKKLGSGGMGEKSGRDDKASQCYERFILKGARHFGSEKQQSWLLAHYRLARIHAARGEKEKALELLRKLLGIWMDADTDLSLLREITRLRADHSGSGKASAVVRDSPGEEAA